MIDVVDLWPEALPIKEEKRIIKETIELILKPLRNFLLLQGDLIIFESKYFQDLTEIKTYNSRVVPLASSLKIETRNIESTNSIEAINSLANEVRILYLGSVNSIIDIESLLTLVEKINKLRTVFISIIGGGERLIDLTKKLSQLKIDFKTYGISYDEAIKKQEFERAHFGYNGYIESTEVAISYKSLEYLANAIPLINSAKGDTYELVEQTRCGFNFNSSDIDSLVSKILALNDSEYAEMKQKAINTFEDNFSLEIFEKKLSTALIDILGI